MAATLGKAHTLTADDVTVTHDHMGREVLVIPDDVARAMNAEIKRGWKEIPDVADGYSRKFREGHWMYEVTQTILAVFAASPVPGTFDDRHRERAQSSRKWAGDEWPVMYAFVVGRGDWDADARWWVDYRANRDLHVSGSPHTANDWWEYLDSAEDVANKPRYVQYQG